MNIDFHHGVTYVVARSAGFNHKQAAIIAYSSQYVDDAVNEGVIRFDNGAMYNHISSAHKMLDYRNFEELANHYAWIPFHFLPGNNGRKFDESPNPDLHDKVLCTPDSFVARDMVDECIADSSRPYSLHRLGITMHVYADTWAHQGFSGIAAQENRISNIREQGSPGQPAIIDKLSNFFGDMFDRGSCAFIGNVLPLGHGAALSNPDKPYLSWSYTNYRGENVERDNTAVFLEAADNMCKAMRRFITGKKNSRVDGLPDQVKTKIYDLLKNTTNEDEYQRHAIWLTAINKGEFGFDCSDLSYSDKGLKSWKYAALNTAQDIDNSDEKFIYNDSFLTSDWKLFHDGLQAHRFSIINQILPRYGICLA